jgi:hypothetical protein
LQVVVEWEMFQLDQVVIKDVLQVEMVVEEAQVILEQLIQVVVDHLDLMVLVIQADQV